MMTMQYDDDDMTMCEEEQHHTTHPKWKNGMRAKPLQKLVT
jgi:hypothetical protein